MRYVTLQGSFNKSKKTKIAGRKADHPARLCNL